MISREVAENLKGGSMIRKMFEEGNRLRALYGAENVFDFSIGNPDMEPPQAVRDALRELVNEPNVHKYMPNAGFADVRATVAQRESRRSGLALTESHVVMTVGAAGGLNTALKALLDPGDEVVILAPYFVEYIFYIRNYSGVPVIVKTDAATFQPDAAAIEAAITPRTKAIILNTPNNPTGTVYTQETLNAIAAVLQSAAAKGQHINVLSDEPYASLLYEGQLPSVMAAFANGIVVNSFSKSHSLPGERIGYLAVNPNAVQCEQLMAALAFANRTLGYVNAPSLFQRVVARSLDATVDVDEYRARRDLLHGIITGLGMECLLPAGAFYLFPKAPGGDAAAFAAKAAAYNILIVPGSGFGWPGHVRVAYCVDRGVIERSRGAWEKLLKG